MNTLYFYIAFGVAVCLFSKWVTYVRHGVKLGRKVWDCTGEWLAEGTLDNMVSWSATVFLLLFFSTAYVERWSLPFLGDFLAFPLHKVVAAFLGYFLEQAAPNIAKGILNKILAWFP